MIVTNALCDWLFCWEPNNKGKYGVCIILDEKDPQVQSIKAEIDRQIAKGVSAGKFTAQQAKASTFKRCLRSGTEEVENGERPERYRGKIFFNANNANPPGIVDKTGSPIFDRNQLYSGCICHVDVGFFPFNNESKGVGAGFNNIMKVSDGERLDGRQSADEAFAGFIESDENPGELQ